MTPGLLHKIGAEKNTNVFLSKWETAVSLPSLYRLFKNRNCLLRRMMPFVLFHVKS